LKIIDGEIQARAIKIAFLRPKTGVLPDAVDRLLARSVVFGACNIALHVQVRMLAGKPGVSAEEAARESTANGLPSSATVLSGKWGVNRAQAPGCTYCAGG